MKVLKSIFSGRCCDCGEDFRMFKVKLNVSIYSGIEPCNWENMQNVERDLCQDCFKEIEELFKE